MFVIILQFNKNLTHKKAHSKTHSTFQFIKSVNYFGRRIMQNDIKEREEKKEGDHLIINKTTIQIISNNLNF